MCRIVQDIRTCLIRHTKKPVKCVWLYRIISEPVLSDTPKNQWNVSDCTGSYQNLSYQTHQETSEMCRIVQDHIRTCLIRHTKKPVKCVWLYRIISEPVLSDTLRNQWNVSDCTGSYQNLSNPTHQEISEMCRIVQDIGILRFYFS